MRSSSVALALSCLFAPTLVSALPIEEDAVFIRVIDCGPGLATVTRMPGDFYMVYDTGHWNQQARVRQAVREVIPSGEKIDLLVISHSDSDHLAATDEILDDYEAVRILRTGLERDTVSWRNADRAIRRAAQNGSTVVNLKWAEFPWGGTYRLGDTWLQFVMGAYWPPNLGWDVSGMSENRNAGSIVLRLTFAGHSVLFTGDAVGRHIGGPADQIIAAEKLMVGNAPVIPIRSDVLIAPHHGADNGSSAAFIEAIDPTWVIFSAGHQHEHPRAAAVARYIAHGVPVGHIFRTDFGDDEDGTGGKEWDEGRVGGRRDPAGDDDVDVLLRPSGEVLVEYRSAR